MIGLVNGAWEGALTFSKVVEEAACDPSNSLAGRSIDVYILSCYYDVVGLSSLVNSAKRGLQRAKARLRSVRVVVDIADWIGKRETRASVVTAIRRASGGLSKDSIRFVPARLGEGRLLHAKAVALVSANRTGGEYVGVLLATSANATRRGCGLDERSNIEFVATDTRPESLEPFVDEFNWLLGHEMEPEMAARQDRFLAALQLLRGGVFYHKWEGSLASSVRFKLDLTLKGRAARQSRSGEFEDYESDSDTVSRDPIGLEALFDSVPKAFPDSFWRLYSVDTLLGKWVPREVAEVADYVLEGEVEPYLERIAELTSSERLDAVAERLSEQVKFFSKNGWIGNKATVVGSWRERVERFSQQRELIRRRIFSYERVPDLIDAERKTAVLGTYDRLEDRVLDMQRPGGLSAVLARSFAEDLSQRELLAEFKALGKKASESLSKALVK